MEHRRRLVLVRHAKAEPFASTDHARTLTERGSKDAGAAGRYLAATGVRPDHAVVSSAARAVGTWERMADAAGWRLEPVVDQSVYNGSYEVVLEALGAVPEDASVVCLVGHNPTVSFLAHFLEDGKGETSVADAMMRGFPTGAVAVLGTDRAWDELGQESARLVDFHVGRG